MAKQNNMAVNQHKRLAAGDTVKGYAKGGSVTGGAQVGKGSPLTQARRNNGIKGMKDGGKC
jgi:hypothetical protein